jgi:predicted SAM-dependent methyltransferase
MKSKIRNFSKKTKTFRLFSFLYRTFRILDSRRKWRKVRKLDRVQLDIGSGSDGHKSGWVTVDLNGAYITHDLRKKLPLQNSSVQKIYSSHFFEHLPYNDMRKVLKECYRVLKKSGEIYIVVPNGKLFINAYLNKTNYFDGKENEMYQGGFTDTDSFIDQVNYIAYLGGEHRYLYDEENLVNILKQSGFNAKLRAFDPELDLRVREHDSVFAVGVK